MIFFPLRLDYSMERNVLCSKTLTYLLLFFFSTLQCLKTFFAMTDDIIWYLLLFLSGFTLQNKVSGPHDLYDILLVHEILKVEPLTQ